MKRDSKTWMTELKLWFIGVAGRLFISALFCTIKVELVGFEKIKELFDNRKFIFAVWHSRLLLFCNLYKDQDGTILISRSKDGEIAARIVKRLGHHVIRGSASRGGLKAALEMIRNLKEEEKPGLIIPDGPRGPRFKVKQGVITMAKETGYPIIPISYSGKKIKIFNSWDRFILPYPFTKCRAVYGEPVYVPKEADKEEEERCREAVEKELRRITSETDSYYNHHIE